MNQESSKRVVLITGCSSGFGVLCAEEFARAGDQVIATMRKPSEEIFAPEENIDVRALDVTDGESIRQCVAEVEREYGRIDVLVNNAGIHLLGAMEDMAEKSLRQVFETNFFGALNLARAVLPGMRERRMGRIITVSSIGSLVGRVMDGVYCASKAAVEIAFEAMKFEVERFGVQVSVVCPGAFRTGIGNNLALPAEQPVDSPYRPLFDFRLGKVRESLAAGGDPQEVASLIRQIAAADEPEFRYIVGDKARQMQQALAGLDDSARRALVRRLADTGWWAGGAEGPET